MVPFLSTTKPLPRAPPKELPPNVEVTSTTPLALFW